MWATTDNACKLHVQSRAGHGIHHHNPLEYPVLFRKSMPKLPYVWGCTIRVDKWGHNIPEVLWILKLKDA